MRQILFFIAGFLPALAAAQGVTADKVVLGPPRREPDRARRGKQPRCGDELRI